MSDAPPPALGELARRATEAEKAIAAVEAERTTMMGRVGRSTDLQRLQNEAWEAMQALYAACSPAVILQLVALATGGGARGLQQKQDLDKTANGRQQEPELPASESDPLTPEEREQYVEWAWRNPNTNKTSGTSRLLAALALAEQNTERWQGQFLAMSERCAMAEVGPPHLAARSLTPERPADAR